MQPSRAIGDPRPQDVQQVIDEQPDTAFVERPSGNSLTGARTLATVGSFECRVNAIAVGPRYLEARDEVGKASQEPLRLIAQPALDRLGNPVDLQHDDVLTIRSVKHRVIYVNRTSFMTEGIIETIH